MIADLPPVTINEIAWMGTRASYNDEWIELYNNTNSPINLDGWVLKAVDGSPEIKLTESFPVYGFYLLERSKDYIGALNNKGEKLELYDNLGNLIDAVDSSSGWPAGDNKTKQTMERTGNDWQTSEKAGGTPGAKNSAGVKTKTAEAPPPQTPQKSDLSGIVSSTTSTVHSTKAGSSNFSLLVALPLSILSGAVIFFLKRQLA